MKNTKKLTNAEILSLSVGVIDFEESDKGLHLYKCLREQIAAYAAISETFGLWATRTTGVRLDFVTDSSFFSFKAVEGKKFELFINGVKDSQIKLEIGEVFSKELDVSNGKNRLTLVFPNHESAVIADVTLDEGASYTRHEHTFGKKIMFIGDSITQGWNSASDSNCYAYQVSLRYDADSVIFGVGGACFDESIVASYDNYHPDVVIVAFGTNDVAKGVDVLKMNMRRFLDKLIPLYKNSKIIGISPIWCVDCKEPFVDFCALIRDIYSEYGIECIDGLPLVSHDTDCYDDNWHPNDKGFIEYADNLIPILDDILKK